MKTVTIHEAKTHLSRLLAEVDKGEEIVVCKGSQPVAKLVPFRRGRRRRPKVGEVTSSPVWCSHDCFAPLADDEAEDWDLR